MDFAWFRLCVPHLQDGFPPCGRSAYTRPACDRGRRSDMVEAYTNGIRGIYLQVDIPTNGISARACETCATFSDYARLVPTPHRALVINGIYQGQCPSYIDAKASYKQNQ